MYHYKAHCTRVVDGDTAELVVDLGFNISHKIRGRLLDVNAPEIFSGTDKDAGKAVKTYLESLILDKSVFVETYKDKMSFNRWIVTIWEPDGMNINNKVMEFCKTLL